MALPPSSQRLPSPPPPTEIQIGPKSTSIVGSSDHHHHHNNGDGNNNDGNDANNTDLLNADQKIIEANSKRRIRPGTCSINIATGPSLIPLNEEHLKALHYDCSRSANDDTLTGPITRENAMMIANPPDGVDKALWLYELCRLLINKCNDLIIGFLFDTPPCSAITCPEMRASEWQFLCAVHEPPRSCCAIDYCCHTLDWATNIVTSQKNFPSRLSLSSSSNSGSISSSEPDDMMAERSAGVKHLTNIFRRLHRIFAHGWFQHRQVFWEVENSTGLYTLYKVICDTYDLMPPDNYKLPPEAEGLEELLEETSRPVISILKSTNSSSSISTTTSSSSPSSSSALTGKFGLVPDSHDYMNSNIVNSRTNTQRHIRQSPSVGSAVTTVIEAEEDDETSTQSLENDVLDQGIETETPLSEGEIFDLDEEDDDNEDNKNNNNDVSNNSKDKIDCNGDCDGNGTGSGIDENSRTKDDETENISLEEREDGNKVSKDQSDSMIDLDSQDLLTPIEGQTKRNELKQSILDEEKHQITEIAAAVSEKNCQVLVNQNETTEKNIP